MVWSLISLPSQQNLTEVSQSEIGWLLGYLSALDSSRLIEAQPFITPRVGESQLSETKLVVLRRLCSLLTDIDPRRMKASYECLERVLRLETGHAARQQLSSAELPYLRPFRPPGEIQPTRTKVADPSQ